MITVGEGDGVSGPGASLFPSGETELLVLTVVVIAFIFAIWLLRWPEDRLPKTIAPTPEHEPPGNLAAP